MTSLHLDLSLGVSGDMLLAAMLDCGVPLARLEQALEPLGLTDSYRLEFSEKSVSGVCTKHLDVIQTKDQPLRHYTDILAIIRGAETLSDTTRQRAIDALTLLGNAEAKVHGCTLDHVHFHEIGAIDTIVDIVGACLLVEILDAQAISATPVNLGSGFVRISHGNLPVPAPAVAELCTGIPSFASTLSGEAATPTGVALIRTLAQTFGPQPLGTSRAIGYGSGGKSGDAFPTFVRAFVLE